MVINLKTILDIYDKVLEKHNAKLNFHYINLNTYRTEEDTPKKISGKHINLHLREYTLKDFNMKRSEYSVLDNLSKFKNLEVILNTDFPTTFTSNEAIRLYQLDRLIKFTITDATTGGLMDTTSIKFHLMEALKTEIKDKLYGNQNDVLDINGDFYLSMGKEQEYLINIVSKNDTNQNGYDRLKHFLNGDFSDYLGVLSLLLYFDNVNLDVKPLTLKNDIELSSLDFENCATENLNKVFVGRRGEYLGYFEINENNEKLARCGYSKYILTGLDDFFNEREAFYSSDFIYVSNYIKTKYIRYCSCGNTYSIKDATGCVRCTTTAKRFNLDLTRFQSKRFGIDDYYSKPRIDFVKGENETTENPLYLGVELEVDSEYENNCGCGDDDCDECNGNNDHGGNANVVLHKMNIKSVDEPHIFAKYDGSLDSGFELVSQPLTLKAHLENKTIDWKIGLSLLKYFDYTSHDKGTCGLHVHINRDFFGTSKSAQLYNGAKIVYLMEKHWDDFVKFTRRASNQLERWAKKEYAKDDFDRLNVKTTKTLSSAFTKNYYRPRNKYVALNTLHDATFEFRIFRGTLNENTFKATLQFVDNLARLVRRTSLKNLTSISFTDIINYKKYPELQAYYTSRFTNNLVGGDN